MEKFEQIERKLKAALAELPEPPDALLFLAREEIGIDYYIPGIVLGMRVFYERCLTNDTTVSEPRRVPWLPIFSEYRPPFPDWLNGFNEAYING